MVSGSHFIVSQTKPSKLLFTFTKQMMQTSTKMNYNSSMSIQKISSTMMVCPVPVPINIHPKNAQIFFIHFLLLHGKYIPEIDVLHHSSPFMLQSAQLIGRSTDDESL
jgi:hypothetical protein